MPSVDFPALSPEEMQQRLTPPREAVRVVIDTDARNEIDDQFALTWALLSQDKLHIEGVYAAPFSFGIHREDLLQADAIRRQNGPRNQQEARLLERFASWLNGLDSVGVRPEDVRFNTPEEGMEGSYEEIRRVFEKLQQDPDGLTFRGSPGYLESLDRPIPSPAAEHLVERALAEPDTPLYVVAIGCLTNVASALLMAPEIIRNIVVLWTSGYPSGCHRPNDSSFNLVQDLLAARLLFDCGVPHVYLPGFHIGAQLRLSLPEMETWVRGKGAIGDYLYWLYTHNPICEQRGITGHFGRTWIIWDMINIAWLLNPDWAPTDLLPSPVLADDLTWRREPGRHLMREAYDIDRDGIFRDFFRKLESAP